MIPQGQKITLIQDASEPVDGRAPEALVASLLSWFLIHARDLPWRRTLDPYAVWVSEIMLQQTQVKTVIPYYKRWMHALPTIHSLAEASSEKIHKLWEGLGYYTRVRNMQKAAQSIVERHGGTFPTSFDDVLALSGIGRYTAGAICSIAFNQAAPIVDGNVIRVLTRLFGIRGNARAKETTARLWKLAKSLVVAADFSGLGTPSPTAASPAGPQRSISGACSALNQSLMELGALVCTPHQPKCEQCPLASVCVARQEGLTEQLPNLGERATATPRRFVAGVVERDGAILVRQRPPGEVNAHLWEFPNVEVPLNASALRQKQGLEQELGCAVRSLTPLTTVQHSITRYRITLVASRVRLNGSSPVGSAGRWISTNQLDSLPFTSAHRKVLAALMRPANQLDAIGAAEEREA